MAGLISQIQILNDSTGFLIQSAPVERASTTARVVPAARVSGVFVAGISDSSPNSLIKIVGGAGGNASVE